MTCCAHRWAVGVSAISVLVSGCTLFAPDTVNVKAAARDADGRISLIVESFGPEDEAGSSAYRGLWRLALDDRGTDSCLQLQGEEGIGLGNAAIVHGDRELLVLEQWEAIRWMDVDAGTEGVVTPVSRMFSASVAPQLLGAWRGADGRERIMSREVGLFAMEGDTPVPEDVAIASGGVSAIGHYVPESDDGSGTGVICRLGGTLELVPISCADTSCVIDEGDSLGRCEDGVLTLDGSGAPVFVQGGNIEWGVGPTTVDVTYPGEPTRTVAELNAYGFAAAPREGGGLVIVAVTYADTLEAIVVSPSGESRSILLGKHEGLTTWRGFSVVAFGEGPEEEIRVYLGVGERLREVGLNIDTENMTTRDITLCE